LLVFVNLTILFKLPFHQTSSPLQRRASLQGEEGKCWSIKFFALYKGGACLPVGRLGRGG